MAPYRQYHNVGPAAAFHWALSLYLILFFAWLLPLHVLSHERLTYADQNTYSLPAAATAQTDHDPDNCQLCRTQGQIGATPVVFAPPEISVTPTDYVTSTQPIPIATNRGPSTLRAPPVTAQRLHS